jgi:hypothetical protein
LPESLLLYSWKVSREDGIIFQSNKKELSYRFFKSGDYTVELSLSFLGTDIYKHTSTFTVR